MRIVSIEEHEYIRCGCLNVADIHRHEVGITALSVKPVKGLCTAVPNVL